MHCNSNIVLTIFWYYQRYDLVAVDDLETAQYGSVQAGLNQIINKVFYSNKIIKHFILM